MQREQGWARSAQPRLRAESVRLAVRGLPSPSPQRDSGSISQKEVSGIPAANMWSSCVMVPAAPFPGS